MSATPLPAFQPRPQFMARSLPAATHPEAAPVPRMAKAISTALFLCYFVRSSVLDNSVFGDLDGVFAILTYIILFATTAWQMFDARVSYYFTSIVSIGLTGVSVVYSQNPGRSIFLWCGWLLVLIAVGPVIRSKHASQIRERAYAGTKKCAHFVVVASFLWLASGAPSLGKGDFTGVMWHSLTLGPICALGGVLCYVRWIVDRKHWRMAYIGCAGILILASVSRASLAAFVISMIIVTLFSMISDPRTLGVMVALFAPIPFALDHITEALPRILPAQISDGFARKGMQHTREGNWQARWEEFEAYPWTGIGFGWGMEGTVGFNEESSRVEAGSSYIAILSMTGLSGAAGMLLIVINVLLSLRTSWKYLSRELRLEIVAVGTFWIVHLGAEGYIFAVGSVFSFWLWLWCGWVLDTVAVVSRPPDYRAAMTSSRLKTT